MSEERALENLRTLLRIPTVSRSEVGTTEWDAFERFAQTLATLYPAVHASLELERFGHTLLFRWKGAGDGDPSVLMAHYDVVAATDGGWEHDPFEAVVDGEGDGRML